MPVLRPLTEIGKSDARFVVDQLVPALARAGFRGLLMVRQREPALEQCVDVATGKAADEGDAQVVIEGSARELDELLRGKAKEPSALDKLKSRGRGAEGGVVVRGVFGALDELVRVCRPKDAPKGASREVGAEAGALALRRRRDRMKLGGRYVKGMTREMVQAQSAAVEPAKAVAAIASATSGGAGDPIAFALANLARFIDAGLDKVGAAGLDEEIAITVHGATRE